MPVVAQGHARLSSVTQHTMPLEFGRKWGTECLNTRPLPTLLCVGYSVKLIYLIYVFFYFFRQEGVGSNWYFPKNVDISTPEGSTVQCRTYEQTIPPPPRKSLEDLPSEDRPSTTYLDCILNGAVECKLPEEYIKELRKIPHNGQKACPKMIEKLNM